MRTVTLPLTVRIAPEIRAWPMARPEGAAAWISAQVLTFAAENDEPAPCEECGGIGACLPGCAGREVPS